MKTRLICLLFCLLMLLSVCGVGCGPGKPGNTAAQDEVMQESAPTVTPAPTPVPTPEPIRQSGELNAKFLETEPLSLRAISYAFTQNDSLTVEVEAINVSERDVCYMSRISGISGFVMSGPEQEVVVKAGETLTYSVRFDLTGKVEAQQLQVDLDEYKMRGWSQEIIDNELATKQWQAEELSLFRTAQLERLQLDYVSAIYIETAIYADSFSYNNFFRQYANAA